MVLECLVQLVHFIYPKRKSPFHGSRASTTGAGAQRQTSTDHDEVTSERGNKLTKDQVIINYVSKGKGGSYAHEINLTSDGNLKNDWPGGFFPERRKELL